MSDYFICRCEDVTFASIAEAITQGARTPQEIKLRTRAGMGMCQGRVCRPAIDSLLTQQTNATRPETRTGLTVHDPVRPVPLCALATAGGAA